MITLTPFLVLITLLLFFILAFYLEFWIPKQRGNSLRSVPLKKRHRLDGLIFIGLIMLLLYRHVVEGGSHFTEYLMVFLIILTTYFYFIRTPKLILKPSGFFYGPFFIHYDRIKGMRLNEKGILFFELERRTLDIHVADLDDLEHIYQILSNLNYIAPTSAVK